MADYASFPPGLVEEWKSFLESDHDLDGLFETASCCPLQRKCEMKRMMEIAESRSPVVYCELGADKGGTVYAACRSLPTLRRVIACEIRGAPYKESFEKAFPDIQFHWLECSSRSSEASSAFSSAPPIDVLFIDGDKDDMYLDFFLMEPSLRERSVVFIHDINDSYGREALELVKSRRNWRTEEVIDVSESREAVAREKSGAAATTAYENWLRHWHGRSAGIGVVHIGEAV